MGSGGWWAIAGLTLGVTATITGMTAFQRRRATVVVPVTTSVQTFLPLLLEPLFLSEHWASAALDGVPIVLGVAIALIGTVLITRTDAVANLAAGSQSAERFSGCAVSAPERVRSTRPPGYASLNAGPLDCRSSRVVRVPPVASSPRPSRPDRTGLSHVHGVRSLP